MHLYDDQFFAVADATAGQAADAVIGELSGRLGVKSVLDLGCGRGVWLSRWAAHGASDILGVDGPYVPVEKLHVPAASFMARDLGQPLALNRQFDLVQSLEVAEHLPEAAAEQFVDNLTDHGKIVLFSAAIPGQGGEHHINEQPWEYWRSKFSHRGYETFDFLRRRIIGNRDIFFWYRHNIVLYVHRSAIESLPPEIRSAHVPPDRPIENLLPLWMRLLAGIIRQLPQPAVDILSRMKQRVLLAVNSLSAKG